MKVEREWESFGRFQRYKCYIEDSIYCNLYLVHRSCKPKNRNKLPSFNANFVSILPAFDSKYSRYKLQQETRMNGLIEWRMRGVIETKVQRAGLMQLALHWWQSLVTYEGEWYRGIGVSVFALFWQFECNFLSTDLPPRNPTKVWSTLVAGDEQP